MFPTRRDFLKTSSLIAWGVSVPTFLSRTAFAAPAAGTPGAKDTILVVVQLTGGNDGLNTVVPFADPEYAKLRPTLKLPKNQLKKINDSFGLHPSLDGLAKLLEEQLLCVVQGVGYPNPNQSHFRSMDIWQAGGTAETLPEGWLGRALKGLPATPSFHLKYANEGSPLAFDGAPVRVPSIASLEEFQLQLAAASGADKKQQRKLIEEVAKPQGGKSNLLDFVKRTAVNTYASSQRLQELAKNYQPKVPYPNTGLANRLKLAAQLISAELGARIFYVSIDGFDTHANQLNAHANLLREVSDAMTAFYKDMAARGHKDRILMMTFSEFGRRPYENGSKGTDHGAAAPMLLVGGKVKAGVVGDHPSLTDHQFGNLKHKIDFRQVYAAILDQWLGVTSKEVLGHSFKPAAIFKS
ncbi:MAG TPA: DUF1501 domain-containing protein [Gemmataceae bacterium]|nr:DUF1501 domain-containing protein [Gemmataceae bacterium]